MFHVSFLLNFLPIIQMQFRVILTRDFHKSQSLHREGRLGIFTVPKPMLQRSRAQNFSKSKSLFRGGNEGFIEVSEYIQQGVLFHIFHILLHIFHIFLHNLFLSQIFSRKNVRPDDDCHRNLKRNLQGLNFSLFYKMSCSMNKIVNRMMIAVSRGGGEGTRESQIYPWVKMWGSLQT